MRQGHHEVLVADLTFEILMIQDGIGQSKSIQDDKKKKTKNSVAIRSRGKVHPKVLIKLVF